MSVDGRDEPDCYSDSSPKTSRSWAIRGEKSECAGKVGLWPERAKVKVKFAAVDQSSKAGQLSKF